MKTAVQHELLSREEFFARAELVEPRVHLCTHRWLPLYLMAIDLLCGLIALYLSFLAFPHNTLRLSFLLLGPLVGTVVLYLTGGYDRRTDFLSGEYASEFLCSILVAIAISSLLAYTGSTYGMQVKPSRAFIPLSFTLFAVPSLFWRRRIGLWMHHTRVNRPILVLGSKTHADGFLKELEESQGKWAMEFCNLPTAGTSPAASMAIKAEITELLASAARNYSAVVLTAQAGHLPAWLRQHLITLHSSVPVLSLNAFSETHWRRVCARALHATWLFDQEFPLAQGSVESQSKRCLDVMISATALLFLAPLLALITLAIRRDSKGPALFRQQRVGRNGTLFTMFKFRTMCENSGEIYTREGDQRITRLGRWLRRSRLDELPQLWNVLIGDMSLIGPRAEWVKCAEIYEQEIPSYHLRHLVKPGITGWAQVNYKYGENLADTIRKLEYDLYYIRHFSIKLDINIMFKTIRSMVWGKGQ